MKVLLTHPGTQHSYKLARQLAKEGLLYQFWTGLALAHDGIVAKLIRLLPRSIRKKIDSRIVFIPGSKVRTMARIELFALWKLYRGGDATEVFLERNEIFQRNIPDKALLAADVIIGFDTASWVLAQRCRDLKKIFVLDVSTPHPKLKNDILAGINQHFPDWRFSVPVKSDLQTRNDAFEMEAAARIVVASSFCKNSLVLGGVDEEKISIIPYGVSNQFVSHRARNARSRTPLKYLFIGAIDAKKGVPLLLDVWKDVSEDEATLDLAGIASGEAKAMIEKLGYKNVSLAGFVSHSRLPTFIAQYDVLVFPSYFDGFGLVILEAMAIGIPVITTKATAGPDLVTHNEDGILIDSGNESQLRDAINYFLDNPDEALRMGVNAQLKARIYTWTAYGIRWKQLLTKHFVRKGQSRRLQPE